MTVLRCSLCLVALAALTMACSGRTTSTGAKDFSVALVTQGPVPGAGKEEATFEGLKAIGKEFGSKVSFVRVSRPSEFEERLRTCAAGGASLVFGDGPEAPDAAANVARRFPGTVFVTTSGFRTSPNLAPIVFELEQAVYLCGLVAGRMSRTARAGLIPGEDLPSKRSLSLAFEAGLKAGNPGARASTVYGGTPADAGGAKAAALALADQGSDFFFQDVGEAAPGVFQVAAERGIWAFGLGGDQSSLSPSVLASAVINVPRALLETARTVRAGGFRGEEIRYGLASGVVSIVINPANVSRVPAPVLADVRRAKADIVAGRLLVPRRSF